MDSRSFARFSIHILLKIEHAAITNMQMTLQVCNWKPEPVDATPCEELCWLVSDGMLDGYSVLSGIDSVADGGALDLISMELTFAGLSPGSGVSATANTFSLKYCNA